MKNDNYKILEEAKRAGEKAAELVKPIPMVLFSEDLFGNRTSSEEYIVEDGVCGFAWINIRPASPQGRRDCPFVKYLRSIEEGRYSNISKSWQIWVSGYNQSMTRKEAYAEAFTNVLNKYGIKAYSNSRLD